jgi:hypothetical protein
MMNTTTPRTALELIDELWSQRPESCCPYVRHSERGCWCASPTLPEGADRYSPCDTASLRLWCITEDHSPRCIFYPAGDVP